LGGDEVARRASHIHRFPGMNILIVDDESSTRTLMDKIVRNKFSCIPTLATNGEEALKKIAFEKPDLILLDVSMPRMNGPEFLKRLRSKDEWKSIPVIMVTATGERTMVEQVASLGVAGYILKPLSSSQIVDRIAEALQNISSSDTAKSS
jgi:CheY-like chemotaxis protein